MKLPEGFDFTQSNLQDYVDCSYRFYMKYILQTKWPALVVNDALDFELRGQTGARFHRLIQQFLLGVPKDHLNEAADSDPEPDLTTWWENFLSYVPAWLEGIRFVESTLSTSLAGHRLIAKYDLVLVQHTGNLIIFDWKTSQKNSQKDWLLEKIQTRLYCFILTQASSKLLNNIIEPEQVTINYWFAPHPRAPVSLPYSQKDYQDDRAYFTGLIEEILDKKENGFSRTSDLKKCRYCVYRSHCDRGTKAGNLADFETFSLGPDDFNLDIDFDDIEEIEF